MLLLVVQLLLHVAVLCILQLHVSARCYCYDYRCSYSLRACVKAVITQHASLLRCVKVVSTNDSMFQY